MGNMCCCIQVDESTVAFKERWGKFDAVLQPGCHFLPRTLGYKLAGNLSLRLQQLDVKCETKTKDNVFVTVVASVQHRVLANKAKDAFYNLSNPIAQIQAHVIDAIGTSVAKLDLDGAFEKKNEISKAVENELVQVMSGYGYEILKTLIIHIVLDERAKRAISEFNAAKKKAEAEASHVDALRNSGLGFSESCPGTTVKDIMDMVVMTRYLDIVKEIGAKSKSSVILMPHGPGGIRDVGTQIRDGLLKASASQ